MTKEAYKTSRKRRCHEAAISWVAEQLRINNVIFLINLLANR
jgi:hypothetical protein